MSVDLHKTLISGNWSFKDNAIAYLNKDLVSLYQIIKQANHIVYLDYAVNMTDCLTISRLAL